MDQKIVIFVIVIGLISAVYPQKCPTQCQCSSEKWDCSGKNITNAILLEIAESGDPLTAKELTLKKNDITDFPSHVFAAFTNLEFLDLSENRLTKVPKDLYKYIPSLTELSLSENDLWKLTKDDFAGYDNVETLDLYKNNIEDLEPNTFQSCSSLTKLFAESNNIKMLRNGTLNGLTKVEELSFQGNDLEEVEAGVFDATPNVGRLWLNKNNLISLPEGLFKNNRELFELHLDNNEFTDEGLSTGIFKDLPLEDLHLNKNNLTTLKKDWFGIVLYTIDLSDNPIACDNCDIYQTYRILLARSDEIDIKGSCNSTDSFKSIPIKTYFEENLSHCTACSVNDCQNNSNCTVLNIKSFTYNCTCPRQFFGQYCETEDFCVDTPCINNGTCLNNLTTFDCQCLAGYTGITCQLEQPCFFTNPCKNNGTCEYMGGTDYLCKCASGYEGTNCKKQVGGEKKKDWSPCYIALIVVVILLLVLIVVITVYRCGKGKCLYQRI